MLIFNRQTNRGKTYRKEERDSLFAYKAELFNKWFEIHYLILEQYFKDRGSYDGNTFTETYLRVYENILHNGSNISNYTGFFLSAYFRIAMNEKKYQNRYQELPEYVELENVDTEYFDELEEANASLERKIFEFVYSFYSLQEYEVFKMYINLKPAISYHSLARITGQKYWYVQRIISTIIQDVKDNKDKIKTGEIYHMNNNDKPIKELDQSYIFSKDYDTLWSLRMRTNYSVICIVSKNGSKCVGNMRPNGEIFASDTCYSNFEGVSKSEFLKQCEELGVEYIKPNYPEAEQGKLFTI